MTAGSITSVLRGRTLALAGLALAATFSTTVHAATVFTSNLSAVTAMGSPTGNNIQLNYDGTVAGITNTMSGGVLGYNFDYMSPSSAYLTGAATNGGGNVKLDGAVVADSLDTQDHGYFLALDSVYQTSAIDIGFSGVAGQTYTVTFDYAGTQQRGFTGASTDFLTVALNGGPSQVTPSVSVPTQGFSGYHMVTDTFTATTTGAETLSFLAGGTPIGTGQDPAFTLLDNINISTVTPPPPSTPEPSSLILLSTGLMGLGGFIRQRSMKAKSESASL